MDKEILYRFFDGTASYKEEEAVCDWAEASAENQDELIKERKYFDVLLVQNKINTKKRTANRITYYLGNTVKYAAAISILLVCGLHAYNLISSNSAIAYNTLSVPAGQRANLILSDGTNVWLNSGTKMQYPASFAKDKREVILNGEAYFEVTKDQKKPFIVQTDKYNIEVLGTKFNVDAYGDDKNQFSAALMEGSIQLTDNLDVSDKTLLAPQQKADYINGRLVIDTIRNYDIYRWKEGLICFEQVTFKELMKEFEKSYDLRIVVENKKLDTYICSGKFRVADGLDFILHVLQRDVKFEFSRNEDNSILYIK